MRSKMGSTIEELAIRVVVRRRTSEQHGIRGDLAVVLVTNIPAVVSPTGIPTDRG
jgi:hypothetical protein